MPQGLPDSKLETRTSKLMYPWVYPWEYLRLCRPQELLVRTTAVIFRKASEFSSTTLQTNHLVQHHCCCLSGRGWPFRRQFFCGRMPPKHPAEQRYRPCRPRASQRVGWGWGRVSGGFGRCPRWKLTRRLTRRCCTSSLARWCCM